MTSPVWGTKIGVLTPGTNLTVESELWAMQVASATVATARIHIDQIAWEKPDDLRRFVEGVTAQLVTTAAQLQVMPDVLMLGISSSPLWDGLAGNQAIKETVSAATGLKLVTPVDAFQSALQILGVTRIGVVTPYPEIADDKIVQFFAEMSVEVLQQHSLRCTSAQAIGEVPPKDLVAAFEAARVDGVQALVQLGTDLRTALVAAQAELWLGLPVLAANTTTWWGTLRAAGVADTLPGWGTLLADH